jgi:aspartyl-tRNA(Asn)/glutamyl-tRNA(Gln) amidotransferase subunit C
MPQVTQLEPKTMLVDDATVRRIGRLARIKIEPSEIQGLVTDLNGILAWVKQLDEVDTTAVAAMTSVMPMTLRQREDRVTDGEKAAEVTANAPMSEDQFYVVPKVVE